MLTGGGTDDQCLKLVAGLRKRGAEVKLYAPADRELSNRLDGFSNVFIPAPQGRSKLKFIFGAARAIRSNRAVIVHGHHGRDIWPTILAARLSGQKPAVILTRHMAKSPSSWPSRNFLLSQVDAIVAVSDFVQRVLTEGCYEPDSLEIERRSRPPLKGNKSKIIRIYGGIDTARFCPSESPKIREEWGLKPGDFAFGVAGGYDPPRGKGQREFLRAAGAISKSIPQARFLIIGRGGLAAQLDQDIRDLGLNGKAWRTPYCSDMPAAMNALDCLVHPQVGTEAFGLVLCEAYACGRPVIASALDGIPEAFKVGNHGMLVSPESVIDLSQAMREVGRWPRLEMEARWKLHALVEKDFSLDSAARNVLRLYQKFQQPT